MEDTESGFGFPKGSREGIGARALPAAKDGRLKTLNVIALALSSDGYCTSLERILRMIVFPDGSCPTQNSPRLKKWRHVSPDVVYTFDAPMIRLRRVHIILIANAVVKRVQRKKNEL